MGALLLVCSAVTSLPYTAANAWISSSAKDLQGLLDGSAEETSPRLKIGVMVLGSAALFGCVAALGWYGRRALLQMEREDVQDERAVKIGPSELRTDGDG